MSARIRTARDTARAPSYAARRCVARTRTRLPALSQPTTHYRAPQHPCPRLRRRQRCLRRRARQADGRRHHHRHVLVAQLRRRARARRHDARRLRCERRRLGGGGSRRVPRRPRRQRSVRPHLRRRVPGEGRRGARAGGQGECLFAMRGMGRGWWHGVGMSSRQHREKSALARSTRYCRLRVPLPRRWLRTASPTRRLVRLAP